MGTDFLNRFKKTFHRALDRSEVALRTPTLFSSNISTMTRTVRGSICKSAAVRQGERFLLRVVDGKVIGQRENDVIIELNNPPAEYLDQLTKCGGVAFAEIKTVLPISEAVEVAFAPEEPTN